MWTILSLLIAGGFGWAAWVVLGIVAPAAALLVSNFVKGAFAFLKTPLGQVCGIAALVVLAFLAGDIRGHRVEKKKWVKREAAAALKYEQLRKHRDELVSEKMDRYLADALRDIAVSDKKLEEEEKQNAQRSNAAGARACVVDRDSIGGLRAPAE